MTIGPSLLTKNFEAKKELLKSYLADYEQLLEDEDDFRGHLKFEAFLKFSYDYDRQQHLMLRREDNRRQP